jgi:hypothetical protein
LSWSETGERKIFGPDLVVEAEDRVGIIQTNLKAAQSRQKSYADQRRKPLQFQIGDFVYLRVSPTKGVQRFGIKGKLAPRYIGPFEILEICGPVAYKLLLPPRLGAIHDIFHVSQLKKCIKVPLKPQPLRSNPIYLMLNNPSKSWIPKKESPEERQLKCIRSYGIITLKRKQLGKWNLIFNRISRLSFQLIPKSDRSDPSSSASESRDEILFSGEGCDIQVIRFIKSKPWML